MIQFLQVKQPGTLEFTFKASAEDDSLQAIMAHNGKSSTFKVKNADGTESETTVNGTNEPLIITSAMADKLRLVVCTGDVVIEPGVHFQGIIMAKGRITLGSGASLESAPLEAAKVFQAQMASDKNMSPKSFSGRVTNMFSEIVIHRMNQRTVDVFWILMIWRTVLLMKTGEKNRVEKGYV